MILATISAGYASWRSARTALDSPGLYPNLHLKGGDIYGRVAVAAPPQNCAGQVLMLSKLEDLMSQHRRAWKSRQVKKAYSIEAEMIALRLDILRAGRGNH